MKRLSRYIVSVFIITLVILALPVSATSPKADSDEAVIHARIKAWSAAAQAKDAEAFVSVYAADAVLMLEGLPDLKGLDAIREGIGGMMQDPNFSLSFEADKVVVAGSGDLAYETGTYSLSVSDPEGNRAEQQGHYVVVWHKEPDGSWKVVIDAPVSDPPATASAH